VCDWVVVAFLFNGASMALSVIFVQVSSIESKESSIEPKSSSIESKSFFIEQVKQGPFIANFAMPWGANGYLIWTEFGCLFSSSPSLQVPHSGVPPSVTAWGVRRGSGIFPRAPAGGGANHHVNTVHHSGELLLL
jgi:hypothetical protein